MKKIFAYKRVILVSAGVFVVLLGIGYGTRAFFLLDLKASLLEEQISDDQNLLKDMKEALDAERGKSADLSGELSAEQEKNGGFSKQIQDLSSTVGTLDKLRKTDPELLMKYSKIYFLNENYAPAKLASIPETYLYNKSSGLQLYDKVLPYFESMLAAASKDGMELFAASAYRSYSDQISVKLGYKMKFGTTAANSFSADQGYSEHQLGTTLDLTTRKIGAGLAGFEKTAEYEWLNKNAYLYGFILSFPKENAYYQYEPWHWRFVGVALAKKLHDEGLHFYDMDQREINTYLISIFN